MILVDAITDKVTTTTHSKKPTNAFEHPGTVVGANDKLPQI
jgi:hypothetical protein